MDSSFPHGSVGSLRGRQIEPAHGSVTAAESWGGRDAHLHTRFPVDFFNEVRSTCTYHCHSSAHVDALCDVCGQCTCGLSPHAR